MFRPQCTPLQRKSRENMLKFRRSLVAMARQDTGISLERARGWRPSKGPRPTAVVPHNERPNQSEPEPPKNIPIVADEVPVQPAETLSNDVLVAPGTVDQSFFPDGSPLYMSAICRVVAAYYNQSAFDMRTLGRKHPEFVLPRQVAMCLMAGMLEQSTVAIGDFFGRDHSSVHHGIYKIRWLIGEREGMPPATARKLYAQEGADINQELQEIVVKLRRIVASHFASMHARGEFEEETLEEIQ